MSEKDNESIQSITDTLNDEKYKLFAFIAISDEGCHQICTGAESRGDLVKIVGELQLLIFDIYDRLSHSENMEMIQELLGSVRESIEEGDEDVRVIN